MEEFNPQNLKQLYVPPSDSHKGENGKVMVIAGSKLFHAASIWPLIVASRIVDMVFYSSVPENNEIVKKEFRDGIIVPRDKVSDYIKEADCVLIGPGLPREEGIEPGDDDTKELTESLLKQFPEKKWVIDGGSLQTMNPQVLLELEEMPILTPHRKEFETLKSRIQSSEFRVKIENLKLEEQVKMFAEEYSVVVLLKGVGDIVCSAEQCLKVSGGNSGMTKGGTGDVLSGLAASLYSKNDAFLSASVASFINKKAGDSLFEKVGPYFNASDLASEIPKVMKDLLFE